MHLPIDTAGRFPVDTAGEPLLYDVVPPAAAPTHTVRIAPGVDAVRITGWNAEDLAPRTGDARTHADHPLAARAVGLLDARERTRFDPADGSAVTWGEAGIVARGASGTPIFPRLDPCVIGVVESEDGERILLAEHRRRPGFLRSWPATSTSGSPSRPRSPARCSRRPGAASGTSPTSSPSRGPPRARSCSA